MSKMTIDQGEIITYNGNFYKVEHPVIITPVELEQSINRERNVKIDYLIAGNHPLIEDAIVVTGELTYYPEFATIAVLVSQCGQCGCSEKCEPFESPKYVITFNEYGELSTVYCDGKVVEASDIVDTSKTMVRLKEDNRAVVQVVLFDYSNDYNAVVRYEPADIIEEGAEDSIDEESISTCSSNCKKDCKKTKPTAGKTNKKAYFFKI